jgi:hypothetical protein
MGDFDSVIIVTTATDWAPIFNAGLSAMTLSETVVTSPRFSPKIDICARGDHLAAFRTATIASIISAIILVSAAPVMPPTPMLRPIRHHRPGTQVRGPPRPRRQREAAGGLDGEDPAVELDDVVEPAISPAPVSISASEVRTSARSRRRRSRTAPQPMPRPAKKQERPPAERRGRMGERDPEHERAERAERGDGEPQPRRARPDGEERRVHRAPLARIARPGEGAPHAATAPRAISQ